MLISGKRLRILGYTEYKKQNSKTDKHETETISYYTINWDGVAHWKPLGLPESVNERVMVEIEKLCEVIGE